MENFTRIKAVINLDNFLYNIESMHKAMPSVPLICVIKADGYGHGAYHLARELEAIPYVSCYAVACADEGIRLRMQGIKKKIMVLGHTFDDQLKDLIDYDIEATVFSFDTAKKLSDLAASHKKTANIHIKLDTGMNRIGFRTDEDYVEEIKKIAKLPSLKLEGIFTHFYRSDEKDKSIAALQYNKFAEALARLEKEGIFFNIKHCANSAAVMELPDFHLDAARAGISIYGLWPSDEMDRSKNDLKAVMSLYSHISHVKSVKCGETIGYGGTFTAPGDMKVATVPVGYADGYARTLSNRADVLIHGQRARICGRICMDQLMVDISHIPDVNVGDEVTLIGTDGEETITIEELGDISGRFNYEFACEINPRVPREYVKGGRVTAQTTNFNTCISNV